MSMKAPIEDDANCLQGKNSNFIETILGLLTIAVGYSTWGRS